MRRGYLQIILKNIRQEPEDVQKLPILLDYYIIIGVCNRLQSSSGSSSSSEPEVSEHCDKLFN